MAADTGPYDRLMAHIQAGLPEGGDMGEDAERKVPPQHEYHYECTQCHKETARELLIVKKAVFLEMGRNGRQLRSRTVAHLCPECTAKDEAWNQPRWSASPGLKDFDVRAG